MLSLDFLITSLIVVLIPGSGVILTISTALVAGKRASLFTAIGCTAGIVPHLLASVLGLSAILHTSALAFQGLAFQGLKHAGVAYLLYLAYATWRDRSAFAVDTSAPAASAGGLVLKACLLNILNPKLTIFFLAFLPQFISHDGPSPAMQMLGLSGVFMAMTFAVFVVYGLLANLFRKTVIESPQVQNWLRRSFAASFAALGLNLAFAQH
ncbi:LysE family translocator [Pseudomonas chlororaphis]|uniref:LysE family translocator n=1 Tax=Pseudomonas chlororaphis TaxID=587753 RepID=UPI000F561D6D|nr:LysE family translocator [Pseudomonas chlororaphis]AZD85245.1 RhtB family transporter [Pseudomonas chlororaphis subsp. aureofaciens]AZD98180.1 RhtB family transporter [Pseudomonas chlororaphis subsp. aureofaciens]AZE22744.1 RhtB family transporter [Pseudomonas chlororaphis subsp. aureofaciens]AZE35328.1 RhtB family transporter [Pseudomonas chlororaphis subsp. aureofaciens]MBP5065400.1 LysE family translocator [Pseudomonas chlororaphis]